MNRRIIRYVAHFDVLDYLRLGWHILVPMKRHPLDDYKIDMEWLCDCPCREPRKSKKDE